ncbi:BREX-1 system adenine-specific DNA-methyltransferase PglX [Enterocloster clostridioformis]|uniref:BREX-1 system adenine-specific DNA-methyltransferase PglX n=1 Tax=Enterocloster clostridioformis TaxID=1531 RepID=UPI0015D4113F|nr:BREX-1 system adenine-specific DNA-methyltransferase PglX [Enterocloster clostridioformis]NSJ54862.1 BREX-1 system adenine-specific DNA-methyltransferase PglX [Enterocloster clostridioformis]
MDKNAIKKYAVWARTELIARVSMKAEQYGITEDNMVDASADSVNGKVLSADEKKQRQALIAQIKDKGYRQVMEEVAYTWFNRFSALRFMEVNGYLPSHVRVFTDEENRFKPQILAEAIHLELDGLDMEKVYALKEAEKTDELYRYLLIVQCNALNKILPGIFQRIADYTELLLPDNLLRQGSVIEQMISTIPEADWKDAVQIIGWLYQYYNSEKKDDVFAALKKNVKITKENIPAATQLFTPDWIVRYMVENSLGRLWLEGHPDTKGQLLPSEEEQAAYTAGNRNPEDTKWHYYLEEAEQEPEVQDKLAEIRKEYAALTPEQIKVIDPCCGSGHILAYMFDVLMQIYESYGYTTREAVASIVENNLYGLDIDDRAAQLAYFAVMMKARQYDRRFLARKDENGNPDVPQPHVYAIVESNHLDKFAIEYFCNGDAKLKAAMDTIIRELHDAKEYGSILTVTPQDWSVLYQRFDEIVEDIDMSRETALRLLLPLVQVAEALAQKYDAVVTNPPYMGSSGMSAKLTDFVKKNYPDSKSDLFAVFIERCWEMTGKNRYQAMITQHAWMFLSSYEKLRTKLQRAEMVNMAHLGPRAFEEIGGEVVQTTSFVLQNQHIYGFKGSYCRLIDSNSQNGKENLYLSRTNCYISTQDNFLKIPGSLVAYWLPKNVFTIFDESKGKAKNPKCNSPHIIDADLLMQTIAEVLKKIEDYSISNWAEFEALVKKNLAMQQTDKTKKQQKRIPQITTRLEQIDKVLNKLYEDNALGTIPQDRYEQMSQKYSEEYYALKAELAELQEQLSAFENAGGRAQKFLKLTERYAAFTDLTPAILNEFISRIEVHERDKKRAKQAIQHIGIYFNYIGKFENEVTQLTEPTEQEIRQMREKIEEAQKEKSRAYHRQYSREYRARNLEKRREYDRMKAREYRAKKKAQEAAAAPAQ